MNKEQTKRISKLLSYVLRHNPAEIGIELDEAGWTDVDALLAGLRRRGTNLSQDQLDEVVRNNDKQRFRLSDDGKRIRASQGHSVDVALGYEPTPPPEFLYHGAPTQVLDVIRSQGLKKQQRHDVHLTANPDTALVVGQRRGKAVLLTIRAQAMHQAGHAFHQSDNGVWLTSHVPANFIDFPTSASDSGPMDVSPTMDFETILTSIRADARYQKNLNWGRARQGHPEGTIAAHIAELEQNLEQLASHLTSLEQGKLRLLIHVHDSFKPDALAGVAIEHPRSHATLARDFLAEFCDDEQLLTMTQYHDEPYALWRGQKKGGLNTRRMEKLLERIVQRDLFAAFLIIDGCTDGKSRDPLNWFLPHFTASGPCRFTVDHVIE